MKHLHQPNCPQSEVYRGTVKPPVVCSCPTTPIEDGGIRQKAKEVVDEFLVILEEWFHPTNDWDKINEIADEFLFEGIVSALKSQKARVVADRDAEWEEAYRKVNSDERWYDILAVLHDNK